MIVKTKTGDPRNSSTLFINYSFGGQEMPYKRKSKSSYSKFPKKAHVVVAIAGGNMEELHVFRERKKAKAKRDELAKIYGLEGEDYEKSPHGKDCRWSDLNEDEVHMHKVDVE